MNRDFAEKEAIQLPEDFAERVLNEVDRRRTQTRRLRGLGTGLALVAVLALAGRLPGRIARGLAHRHPAAPTQAFSPEVTGDDVLADDADLDPGSFFLASADRAQLASDTGDLGDDPDSDLLGQE